jgi:hypothetical protein
MDERIYQACKNFQRNHPVATGPYLNSESIGSIIDRLSIAALRQQSLIGEFKRAFATNQLQRLGLHLHRLLSALNTGGVDYEYDKPLRNYAKEPEQS